MKKHYTLIETGVDNVAVIQEKKTLHEFYLTIRKALAEHFVVALEDISLQISDKSIDNGDLQYTFDATIIEDGGEESIREFILSEITIY